MPYVLDTDTISLLERGDRALREHIAALPAEDVFVTVVSLEEQMRGRLSTLGSQGDEMRLAQSYAYLKRTLDFYCAANVLRYDEAAGAWDRTLARTYRRLGTKDRRIAAIALTNRCTLITRNTIHFRAVSGLALVDWTHS